MFVGFAALILSLKIKSISTKLMSKGSCTTGRHDSLSFAPALDQQMTSSLAVKHCFASACLLCTSFGSKLR